MPCFIGKNPCDVYNYLQQKAIKRQTYLWQTSPSAHSGAVSAENIASDSFNVGNLYPSAFSMFTVS